MTTSELITALQRLNVETESIACLGCGHEHNCGIHGCAIIREAVHRLYDIYAVFNEDAVVRLTARCLKVEPARLRELAEADKAGRLVVLPCKVGDIVWANLDKMRHTRKCVIEFANIGSHVTTIVFSTVDGLREQYGVNPCSFGKTVFLTREEAEKVLEAKEGCNP